MFIYLFLFGWTILSLIMASKVKINHNSTSVELDYDKLESILDSFSDKIAYAIAKELKNLKLTGLSSLINTSGSSESYTSEISMDDSIIPSTVQSSVQFSNVDSLVKKETKKDKDLNKSKNKLASLLKNKK